ncbi:MAG: DUF123 domain-containing protein [Promethearchaeota archaeon]
MKGTYLLVVYFQQKCDINIGALGLLEFQEGYYIYVGSAMGNKGSTTLLNRVKRHVDTCDKYINNFGSSDCNCDSHLYYFSQLRDFL